MPRKDGSCRTISFGFADINLSNSIEIGIKYKKRGIIEQIIFKDVFSKTEFPVDRFKHYVKVAEDAVESEFYISSDLIIPYDLCFQNTQQYASFSILKQSSNKTSTLSFASQHKSCLHMRLRGFDRADVYNQFMIYIRPILDVLSAFTNLFFDIGKVTQSVVFTSSHQLEKPIFDIDWIDGYPIVAREIILTEHCLQLIDHIIQENIDRNKQLILDACHHFHSARSLQERIKLVSQSESLPEIVTVLYMSSIEVLSLVNALPPVACPTCSQPQHRISARVVEFMKQHNGEAVANMIKELYNARSKYLHMGSLLSSRSYSGETIPQLNFANTNGVLNPMSLVQLHNLREYTSFCIRATTYGEYNGL